MELLRVEQLACEGLRGYSGFKGFYPLVQGVVTRYVVSECKHPRRAYLLKVIKYHSKKWICKLANLMKYHVNLYVTFEYHYFLWRGLWESLKHI